MKCSKHPSYSGTRWKKQRCPECDALYKEINTQSSKYGKYVSLTTPSYKCTIIHLLSEISCLMLFGRLPQFFWLKASSCPRNIRDYFWTTSRTLNSIKQRKPEMIKSIENILYITFVQKYKQSLSEKATAPEQQEALEHKQHSVDINIKEKDGINKWRLING